MSFFSECFSAHVPSYVLKLSGTCPRNFPVTSTSKLTDQTLERYRVKIYFRIHVFFVTLYSRILCSYSRKYLGASAEIVDINSLVGFMSSALTYTICTRYFPTCAGSLPRPITSATSNSPWCLVVSKASGPLLPQTETKQHADAFLPRVPSFPL